MSVFELMVCKSIKYSIYWPVLSDEFYLGQNPDFRLGDLEFARTITESLQTLRRVKLDISLYGGEDDPLQGFCDELEEISEMNKLECIEIHLLVWHEYKAHDEWHRLEEVLIKSGWRELKSVSITITFGGRYPTAFELAHQSFQHKHFLRLRKREHLDFQFSVENSNDV